MTILHSEREIALQTPFALPIHLRTASFWCPLGLRNPRRSPLARRKQQVVTAILVVAPLLGVVAAALGVISPRVTLLDVILAVGFYAVSGHGLTAGFHRMLTHRSFKAARWVKITLAVAGSLGMEGSVISWVANHRRHHALHGQKGRSSLSLRIWGGHREPDPRRLARAHWMALPSPADRGREMGARSGQR